MYIISPPRLRYNNGNIRFAILYILVTVRQLYVSSRFISLWNMYLHVILRHQNISYLSSVIYLSNVNIYLLFLLTVSNDRLDFNSSCLFSDNIIFEALHIDLNVFVVILRRYRRKEISHFNNTYITWHSKSFVCVKCSFWNNGFRFYATWLEFMTCMVTFSIIKINLSFESIERLHCNLYLEFETMVFHIPYLII